LGTHRPEGFPLDLLPVTVGKHRGREPCTVHEKGKKWKLRLFLAFRKQSPCSVLGVLPVSSSHCCHHVGTTTGCRAPGRQTSGQALSGAGSGLQQTQKWCLKSCCYNCNNDRLSKNSRSAVCPQHPIRPPMKERRSQGVKGSSLDGSCWAQAGAASPWGSV
jgi:hypothetical protein